MMEGEGGGGGRENNTEEGGRECRKEDGRVGRPVGLHGRITENGFFIAHRGTINRSFISGRVDGAAAAILWMALGSGERSTEIFRGKGDSEAKW